MHETVVLVDTSWMAHRSYHTHKSLGVETKNGFLSTGVVFGFTRLVRTLYEGYGGNVRIIFCMDDKDSSRKDIYEDYKADREYKPEVYEMIPALPRIFGHMKSNVGFAKAPGKEADDLMAMLSLRIAERNNGQEVICYTGDNDMLQLMEYGIKVSRKVEMGLLKPVDQAYINKTFAKDKFNLPVELLLRFRAIVGDQSDHIPPAVPRLNRVFLMDFISLWREDSFLEAVTYYKGTKRRELAQKVEEAKPEIIRNLKLMSLVKYRKPENWFVYSMWSEEGSMSLLEHLRLKSFISFLEKYGMTLE